MGTIPPPYPFERTRYSPIPFLLLIVLLLTITVFMVIMLIKDHPVHAQPPPLEQLENSVYKNNSP